MIKIAAGCVLRVCVRMAKNAAIRAANEAAGKPLPSVLVDGAIGVTDEMLDCGFRWFAGECTSAERLQEAHELASLTAAQIVTGIAQVLGEETADGGREVKQQAVAIAEIMRRNLQLKMTKPDANGRSVLQPSVRLDSTAEFAELVRPVEAHVLAPGDEIGGRYTVERFIARGGMGAIYLATQKRMMRQVAIKTILPAVASRRQFRERFFEEAQLIARLDHPNIVTVYEADEDVGRKLCFLAMEYLSGQTLDEWLRHRSRGCTILEFAELYHSICSALIHAHERGVLHLDLKPTNVMVNDDLSEITVVDFGLGKACGVEAGAAAMVTTVGGTPYFMAPEQLRGQKADARADVYSLGVMFYQLLVGEQPVAGCEPISEVRREVPATISDAIRCAMKPRPDQRTPSVRTLCAAIDEGLISMREGALGAGRVVRVTRSPSGKSVKPQQVHHEEPVSALPGTITGVEQRGLIERAVRRCLKYGPDRPLSRADFAEVAELVLFGSAITDASVAWLSTAAAGFSRLRALDLSRTMVTDMGVRALARSDGGLAGLQVLYLHWTGVSDAGVRTLSSAQTGLRGLQVLAIGHSAVSDAGVIELARPGTGLTGLTVLNLNGSRVTDAGVTALADSATGLDRLKTLFLYGTEVSRTAVAALEARFPGIQVFI